MAPQDANTPVGAEALMTAIHHLAPTGCEAPPLGKPAPRWARLMKCGFVRAGRTRRGRLAAVFQNIGFGHRFAIALSMPETFGLAEIVDPSEVGAGETADRGGAPHLCLPLLPSPARKTPKDDHLHR